MDNWANQSHFLDRDTSFVSPLESAGNLGNYEDISGLQISSTTGNFLGNSALWNQIFGYWGTGTGLTQGRGYHQSFDLDL